MAPSPQYKFLRQAPRDGLSTAAQPSRWQQLHIDPWLCSFLVKIFINNHTNQFGLEQVKKMIL